MGSCRPIAFATLFGDTGWKMHAFFQFKTWKMLWEVCPDESIFRTSGVIGIKRKAHRKKMAA